MILQKGELIANEIHMKKPTKTTKKVEKNLEKKIEELELRIAILESRGVVFVPHYPPYPQPPQPLNPWSPIITTY